MIAEFECIELVFENCNQVVLTPELVVSVLIRGIKEDIIINGVGQFIQQFECEHFEIELKNEALERPTHFEKEFKVKSHDFEGFKDHVKEYRDITHVSIKDSLGEEHYICIPWDSDSHYGPNKLQKNTFNKNTFLIECSGEKKDGQS